MKPQYKIVLMIVFAVLLLMIASFVTRPTAAQDASTSLRARLENLRGSKNPVTIEFGRPLVSGELIWTLPDGTRTIGEIGDDYVCFSEPWNDTTKDRCTPFSNIVSVSFVR
jgi:hypothetical protein